MADAAALQITQPIALGLNLEGGSALLAASALSVAVNMQSASLYGSTQGADIGVSAPFALGVMLSANNGNFAITASALSVPVAMQSAALLLSALPQDTFDGTLLALPLGLLLGNSGFTLSCSVLNVPVNIAAAEASEEQSSSGAADYGAVRKKRYVYEAGGKLVVTTDLATALRAARGKPVPEPTETRLTPSTIKVSDVKDMAQKYAKEAELDQALTKADFDRVLQIYEELWTQQDEEDIEALLLTVH